MGEQVLLLGSQSMMTSFIGPLLIFVLTKDFSLALPQDDGVLLTMTVSRSPSDYTWVSSWATDTTGTAVITYSPYLEDQTMSFATGESSVL